MRARRLILSTLLSVAAISPSLAAPVSGGLGSAWDVAFGGSVGGSDYNFRGVTDTHKGGNNDQARVSAYFEPDPRFAVQGDIQWTHQDMPWVGSTYAGNTLDLGAHLSYRITTDFRVGAIAQYSSTTASGSGFSTFVFPQYFAGLEGQYTLNNFTVYSQIGAHTLNQSGADWSGWTANTQVRYFVAPNWRLDFRIGYDSVAFHTAVQHSWELDFGAEYQLQNLPNVMAFVHFEHGCYGSSSSSTTIETNTIRVGMNWAIDQRTPEQRSATGITFDPFRSTSYIVGF